MLEPKISMNDFHFLGIMVAIILYMFILMFLVNGGF